jgi:hypothetical protein
MVYLYEGRRDGHDGHDGRDGRDDRDGDSRVYGHYHFRLWS